MWLEQLASSVKTHVFAKPSGPNIAGLALGQRVESPHRPVVLPDRHRCEHAVIIGKTGTGKTYLLESLALQLAVRGEGFAFFDFHCDASLSLLGRLSHLRAA